MKLQRPAPEPAGVEAPAMGGSGAGRVLGTRPGMGTWHRMAKARAFARQALGSSPNKPLGQ